MSLVKADQVRRELFAKYSEQIAALLGEAGSGQQDDSKEAANEHDDHEEAAGEEQEEQEEKEKKEETGAVTSRLSDRFRVSYARQHLLRLRALRLPRGESPPTPPAISPQLAGGESFPAARGLMRRVQEESLRTLIREAGAPPPAYRDEKFAAQRMEVLHEMEEQIGKERVRLLARQQKMDGKLHPTP